MKNFTKRPIIQKIIFAIAIVMLLVNFTLAPVKVYADDDGGWSLSGTLAKEFMGLLTWLCDIIMSGLNNFMLGANGFGSAMLAQNDVNVNNEGSWIYVENPNNINLSDENVVVFNSEDVSKPMLVDWFDGKYSIPNMLYSPENIFANNIAALDINFLRENKYKSIYVEGDREFRDNANAKSESAVKDLKGTIASWYKSFRNIAIVGLLSVLIYLGIRILISTAVTDKAKYKEILTDWVVALCLVFVIHIIMSAILMLTDKCTEIFSGNINDGYIVVIDGDKREDGQRMAFRTNLTGLMRFSTQSSNASTAVVYGIMYMALVIYTCIFTIMYLKRLLYMAFFTMIAPLVALTYPIDRAGDGKSQAFDMWFKEYTMNAIIQPVHLIIYTVFVGSAYGLVAKNPLYAIAAIGFLTPAEKFIKKMFGLDKAESTSGFGSFAGGAFAMNMMKQLSGGGKEKSKKEKGGKSADGDNEDEGIFIPPNDAGELKTFGTDGKTETDGRAEGNSSALNKNNQMNQEALDEAVAEGFGPGDPEYDKYLNEGNNQEHLEEETSQNVGAQLNANTTPSSSSARGITSSNSKGKPGKTVVGALGGVLSRGGKVLGRKIRGVAKELPGNAARFTGRAAIKAATLAATGVITAGAAITNPDNIPQFVATGAMIGNSLGNRAYNGLVEPAAEGVVNLAKDTRNAYNEERHGIEEATNMKRERLNKKARENFMNDENEVKRYRNLASQMDYNGDVENLMSAAADYKEAGVTDNKLIQNALIAEYRDDKNTSFSGDKHKAFVDTASLVQQKGFGKEYIEDDKKRASLENFLESKVKGASEQRRAAQTVADIYDLGDMYRNVGTLGTPARAAKKSNSTKSTPKKQPKNNE